MRRRRLRPGRGRRRSGPSRLASLFVSLSLAALALAPGRADLVFGTWNLNWFPSGLADRKAPAGRERERILSAAGILRDGLLRSGAGEGGDVVLFLQEMRGPGVCGELVEAVALPRLRVVEASRFKDPYGIPVWQQLCLASTLPPVETGSPLWLPVPGGSVSRGYSYAVFRPPGGAALICVCLHLKSNLALTGGLVEEQRNIYKREKASAQILKTLGGLCDRYGEGARIVIAGDFNTDEDSERFVSEATLRSFYGAHFRSCFTGVPEERRVTLPASGPYPDATFDYILYRGLEKAGGPLISDGRRVSDHHPVFIRLRVPAR